MGVSLKINSCSQRYEKFALAYVRTGCSATAYEEAGYKKPKNKTHGSRLAWEILNRPEVQLRISQIQQELRQLVEREMAEEWKKARDERRALAYSSIDDILDFSGDGAPSHRPANKIPKQALRAISSVDIELADDGKTAKRVKYRMASKDPHLEALEDKYSVMPDNQRPVQKVDVTSGGMALSVADDQRESLFAILAAIKARVTLPLPEAEIVVPESNGAYHGPTLGPSTNGSNGHV